MNALITKLKENNKFASSVYVYPDEDYAHMRLFLTEDGHAGFAQKPDGDIVSVFAQPSRLLLEVRPTPVLPAFSPILPRPTSPPPRRV